MAAPTIGRRPGYLPPITGAPDPSHPLTAGLVGLVLATRIPFVEQMTGTVFTTAGSPAPNYPTIWGPGVDCVSSTNKGGLVTIGSGHPLSLQKPLTIAWVGVQATTPPAGALYFGVTYDGGGGAPFDCYTIGATTTQYRFTYNNGTIRNVGGTTSPTSYRGPLTVVGVHNGSIELWVNGAREATGSDLGGTISYSGASQLSLSALTSPSRGSNTGFMGGYIWNRALSANEVETFNADPFCMIRY